MLVHTLPALPGAAGLAAVAVAAVCLAYWLRRFWPVGFAAAFAWTVVAAQQALDERLPERLDRSDVRLTGWVDDFPRTQSGRVLLSVRVEQSQLPVLRGARVRLNWYAANREILPGQRLHLTARLRTPHAFVNPAGFDYERWLLLERYAATGYVRAVHTVDGPHDGFAAGLLRVRAAIRERIDRHLDSADAAALVTALAIGDRSGFSERHWEVFRRSGTSHLVAISGLHIGIVAFTVFWLIGRLMAIRGSRLLAHRGVVAGACALLAAVGYAALAGFSISTLRAVVMLAAALLVGGLHRNVSRFHALALTAVVLTGIDPMATLGNSFWLSFGAVFVLLAATVRRRIGAVESGMRSKACRVLSVQAAVAMAAVPAGAALFGEFSLIAAIVNLVAIPLFGFALVPLVLVSVLAEMLTGASGWLIGACGWLGGYAMKGLGLAAAFPAAAFVVATPPWPIALLCIAGVLAALPWHAERGRPASALALLPLIWPRTEVPGYAEFRLAVLDVGHGLAVIAETQSSLLVYDAGARFDSGFDIGADVVLPVLRGKRQPQMLIVSHSDNDHSGGAAALLGAYPDTELLTGPDVEIPGSRCVAGQRWTRDGVQFQMLHPQVTTIARGNDSSCVLRIAAPGASVLLTGDIERAGEREILARHDIDVDVVIAPHHGSETSSTPEFVAAASPSIAVFSAGYGNRWDFPRAAVVARWCAVGADVYVTGEHGAIEIALQGGSLSVAPRRRTARHYWRSDSALRCGESPGSTL